jgi:tetratricopeptide (TPR) repeat protein
MTSSSNAAQTGSPIRRSHELALGVLMTALLGYLVLVGGGVVSATYYQWQVVNWLLGLTLTMTWLLWRGLVRRAMWPRTGLEPAFGVLILAALVSLIASAAWRTGTARLIQLAGFVIVFYLALDLLDSGLPGAAVIDALIVVSGLALAAALLEVYAYYLFRWEDAFRILLYRPVTLLGHPNLLMGVANLALPFLPAAWLAHRSIWARSGLLLWGLCYLLAVPFASSRGAMLGLAIMIVLAGALLARRWWKVNLQQWLARLRTRAGWLMAGGGVVLLGLGTLFVYQSAHPSHGGLLSRLPLWQIAGQVIAGHFWLGAGPGQFGFESARFSNTPPFFWPIHAHSVPLQTFGEFGLIGILALAGSGAAMLRIVWRSLPQTSGSSRLEALAGCLGLAGFATQNAFDDHTHVLAAMVPLMLVAALVFSRFSPARSRMPLAILGLPLVAALAVQGTWLRAYQSFNQARQFHNQGDKYEAYMHAREALRLDPSLAFYQTSAGLLAAQMGAWPEAQAYLERAAGAEDSLAFVHANLGMARWKAGDPRGGLEAMQTAALLAPSATTIRLALGWMAEDLNETVVAEQNYGAVLTQRPEWRDRDFWAQTPLRNKVLTETAVPEGWQPQPVFGSVELAMARGELAIARELVDAYFLNDSLLPAQDVRVRLLDGDVALAEGRTEAAMRSYELALFQIAYPSIGGTGQRYWDLYGTWLYGQEPLPLDSIEGLQPLDYKQPEDLPRFLKLAEWAQDHRPCIEARRIDRAVYQLDRNSQALVDRMVQPCK